MSLCTELFEPRARRRWLTHTCDLEAGHPLPHHCPRCGSTWNKQGGPVTAPISQAN